MHVRMRVIYRGSIFWQKSVTTLQTSHSKGSHGNAAPKNRYCVTKFRGIPTHLETPMPLNRAMPGRVEP